MRKGATPPFTWTVCKYGAFCVAAGERLRDDDRVGGASAGRVRVVLERPILVDVRYVGLHRDADIAERIDDGGLPCPIANIRNIRNV